MAELAKTSTQNRMVSLTEELEQRRREAAAASAAAAEAWAIAQSAGVSLMSSRAQSESGTAAGTPVRRNLHFPSHFSAPHGLPPLGPSGGSGGGGGVRQVETEALLEVERLRAELKQAKRSARDAVKEVVSRLQIEITAKMEALRSANEAAQRAEAAERRLDDAEKEAERAWGHANESALASRSNATITSLYARNRAVAEVPEGQRHQHQPSAGLRQEGRQHQHQTPAVLRQANGESGVVVPGPDGGIVISRDHALFAMAVFAAMVSAVLGSLVR
jgi:hypothetical protein